MKLTQRRVEDSMKAFVAFLVAIALRVPRDSLIIWKIIAVDRKMPNFPASAW